MYLGESGVNTSLYNWIYICKTTKINDINFFETKYYNYGIARN